MERQRPFEQLYDDDDSAGVANRYTHRVVADTTLAYNPLLDKSSQCKVCGSFMSAPFRASTLLAAMDKHSAQHTVMQDATGAQFIGYTVVTTDTDDGDGDKMEDDATGEPDGSYIGELSDHICACSAACWMAIALVQWSNTLFEKVLIDPFPNLHPEQIGGAPLAWYRARMAEIRGLQTV